VRLSLLVLLFLALLPLLLAFLPLLLLSLSLPPTPLLLLLLLLLLPALLLRDWFLAESEDVVLAAGLGLSSLGVEWVWAL